MRKNRTKGKVEVTIGKENKSFQEGPFSCFGEQLLQNVLKVEATSTSSVSTLNTERSISYNIITPTWVPDYTLKAITDVVYLKIRKNT